LIIISAGYDAAIGCPEVTPLMSLLQSLGELTTKEEFPFMSHQININQFAINFTSNERILPDSVN